MTEKIQIRRMIDGDLHFILATWLKSFRASGDIPRRIRDSDFFPIYEPFLKELINKSDTHVACLADDWDVIAGFMTSEQTGLDTLIHYCFVKEAWRKMGIARLLLDNVQKSPSVYFTHWTSPIESISHKLDARYNPYRLFR